jgi:hypothetical protein
MAELLTDEQKEKLKGFEPNRPLVVRPNEIDGLENFAGKFVFKRPTVKDRIDIAIRQSKLKENTELDVISDNVSYMLATFAVICTEKPADFSFDELYEIEPLYALFGRYSDWLECFRLSVQARKEAAGATK